MKREVIGVILLLVLISAGAVAQVSTTSGLGENVEIYVKNFVDKGGLKSEDINSISEIDPNDLPDEVKIKDIADNKVGIYEVNYTEQNANKKLFVVTYSTNQLEKKTQDVKNIQYLSFGFSGSSNSSTYLETSNGVPTDGDNGYVMMRSGSITGVSTSIKLSDEAGDVSIKVYKNGKDTLLSNMISSEDKNKVDYDLQSEDVVNFLPGDVISVYVDNPSQLNFADATTLVEITF